MGEGGGGESGGNRLGFGSGCVRGASGAAGLAWSVGPAGPAQWLRPRQRGVGVPSPFKVF